MATVRVAPSLAVAAIEKKGVNGDNQQFMGGNPFAGIAPQQQFLYMNMNNMNMPFGAQTPAPASLASSPIFYGSGFINMQSLVGMANGMNHNYHTMNSGRFIQHKLEGANEKDKQMIFNEVVAHAQSLLSDVFGNYVIQKALESIDAKSQMEILNEMEGQVMKYVNDQNGNHVVQKVSEKVKPEKLQFIIDSFLKAGPETVTNQDMGTLTLARYILWMTDVLRICWCVGISHCCRAFLLALKIKDASATWTPLLQKYSGLRGEDVDAMMWEVNHMMHMRTDTRFMESFRNFDSETKGTGSLRFERPDLHPFYIAVESLC